MLRYALVMAVVLGGCDLYWNQPAPDAPICNGADLPPSTVAQLRDPSTGQCETISEGGTTCGCGQTCGGISSEPPPWGACHSACDNLDESQCLATPGCHAAYTEGGVATPDGTTTSQAFLGCWAVAPDGEPGGVCEGLDPLTCTQHDDCVGLYVDEPNNQEPGTEFDRCAPEPGGLCSSDTDCLGGEQCDTSTCHQAPCPPCNDCGACAPTCYGVCTPGLPPPPPPPAPCSSLSTEAACTARTDCEAVYTGYNCTCDLSGCTCQTETFASCEAR